MLTVLFIKFYLGTTSNDNRGEDTQQFTTNIDQDKMTSSSTSTSEQNVSLLKSSKESDNNETKKKHPPLIFLLLHCVVPVQMQMAVFGSGNCQISFLLC